jgi:hypothetical protein
MKALQIPVSGVASAQTPISPQQTGITPYQTNGGGMTEMLSAIMPLIMIMMVMMSVGKH